MAKKHSGDAGRVPTIDAAIRESEDRVRRERDKAQRFVQAMDKYLDDLDRVKVSAGRPLEPRRRDSGPFRYLGMTMIEAIETFLDKAGSPQTREQIMDEMRDGGAVLAQKRPEVEVNKSIDYWLLSEAEKRHKYKKRKIKIVPPRLKRFGEKVGRVGWPQDKK
ncbi:MAG TPA: hypothetical protein VI488_19790 [Candidatus Angelobacter sp.]